MIAMPGDDAHHLAGELHAIETAHGRLDRHVIAPPTPTHGLDALSVAPRATAHASAPRTALTVAGQVVLALGAFIGASALIAMVVGNIDGMSGGGAWLTRAIHVPPFVALFAAVALLGLGRAIRRSSIRQGQRRGMR